MQGETSKGRPRKIRKKRTFGNRSHTVMKDLTFYSGKMPYDHPLSEKSNNGMRVSLDHLTFNQIKLERIRQERKIDTVQKKLKILKHNFDYVDNKLNFKLKNSLTTIHSKKQLVKEGSLMNKDVPANSTQKEHKRASTRMNSTEKNSVAPISIECINEFPTSEKLHTRNASQKHKQRIKCNPLMHFEQK